MGLFRIFSNNKESQRGVSLVELLITIGLAALILPALLTGFVASRGGRVQQEQRLQAIGLFREAHEAVRQIRESAMEGGTWAAFATNGTYHPVINGSVWELQPHTETTSDGFTRSIEINDVYRDTSNTIVESGGSLDSSTKKVTILVCWGNLCGSEMKNDIYLSRYANESYTETLKSEFEQGTYSHNIVITDTGGGAVILGPGGGRGDWCKPNLSINALDLPGQGITTAVSSTYGHAYTTSGGNSSGNSMDSVLISDPPTGDPVPSNDPPPYNYRKTYGIYADDTYEYLTSDHPGLTVDIVSKSKPFTQIGYFDARKKGTSVYAVGSIGYVTAEDTLYSFDISSISGSNKKAQQLGQVSLAGDGNRVVVVGQYAYVATTDTSSQLQIIDVSNPQNMSVVASMDMNNGEPGIDVSVDDAGAEAYVVTERAATGNEFFVVNLASRNITKSYDTGGMDPKEVALVPGGWGIVVGSGGDQYQVFRTSDSATTPCGSITNPHGANSVNAVDYIQEPDGDVYSYILTDNASKEFQIIAGGGDSGSGGPGGTYTPSGIFESRTMNAGHDVAFNNFNATLNTPSGTNISFKVAIKPGVSGSCSGVSFADSDFVTFPLGPLPLLSNGGYNNPGQCMRYRAYLSTTDSDYTPTLFDITFNYSL